MFHNFLVTPGHRDYLRFLWHEDNDISKPLIDYHMNVHVFGNSPSPAVATYGLRKAVENAETDVQDFIYKNFYVDNGLVSCRTSEEAINLLARTQHVLHDNGKLRLHNSLPITGKCWTHFHRVSWLRISVTLTFVMTRYQCREV